MPLDKILVAGQSYGDINYRDWACIANDDDSSLGMNKTLLYSYFFKEISFNKILYFL